MALPYFYMEQVDASGDMVALEEDTSKHVVQVLRMGLGEKLQLTDGKGNLYTAEIMQVHKKSTGVKILSGTHQQAFPTSVTIAISLLKNASRFEWFLEKATEIGVTAIIPLFCDRTEKHRYRFDRMKSIIVSAMLQSQQSWLPKLSEPISLAKQINGSHHAQKLIAHCEETDKRSITDIDKNNETIILIGPEGDFSSTEIELAMQHNFFRYHWVRPGSELKLLVSLLQPYSKGRSFY